MYIVPPQDRTGVMMMCCSYVLRVVARDLGAEPRSSNATSIFVTVSDENDNDPEILNIASGVTVALVDEVMFKQASELGDQ